MMTDSRINELRFDKYKLSIRWYGDENLTLKSKIKWK